MQDAFVATCSIDICDVGKMLKVLLELIKVSQEESTEEQLLFIICKHRIVLLSANDSAFQAETSDDLPPQELSSSDFCFPTGTRVSSRCTSCNNVSFSFQITPRGRAALF